MSLNDTFDVPCVKYGNLKVTGEDVFFNCPGSMIHKEYNPDVFWNELIQNDNAICVSVSETGSYNVYSVSENNILKEYRLVLNEQLSKKYESKSSDEYEDTRLEYEGYLYVDPKLMICDPASFVSEEKISIDLIKKSVKDNESLLCDFGTQPNNESIVVYVFQVLDIDDEVLEFRLTNNVDLAKKYTQMLENDDLTLIIEDLQKTSV